MTKDFNEDDILRKAILIFWEKGYNATSIHDLIDGLGIGRSSIYHAFGDKHSLFVKALELYQSEGTEKIKDIVENAPSLKMALETLLNAVAKDILNTTCPKGCFKVNSEVEVAAQDEIVNKLVYNDDLIIEEALHKAFKKGQQNGEIQASKAPLALARFFCNTIAGMRVYAKFRNERQFFDDIAKKALFVIG
ncbi:Transcriptional regulator, TetR family [Arcticibacter svalbardensis MN12-7]|uniref:Transcriptional regulator, TetR family n=1 Tax=Arcticibacter svalbardensis MN12-7 TaxID=1150600 RepID=R9GZ34_9SPHI|nr:TetR/AcrR family transcriptional regulator [Arcticibacter svalbardensis]EOR94219.1 Transcriptional regulator, TetR family [Arcticibacter svalbardensis MN12-7]